MHDISALFATQDGAASLTQLHAHGATPALIRQRIGTGEWQRLGRGIVGVAAHSHTWRRSLRVALLSAGDDAALSGPTAARLHRLDGFDRADLDHDHDHEIHVTTFDRRHHTATAGVVLHRSRVLARRHCVLVDCLLCVSKAVALVQLAATHHRDRVGQALDGMLRDGDSDIWIARVAADWSRSGVSGPAVVLELLHERVNKALPRSWFQRLAKRAMASHGFQLVDEHPVVATDGTVLAELDLAIPELRIGVECQSWRWHSTPTARARDARRKRRLRMLGWELVEVWWTDLERLDDIAAELAYLIALQRNRHFLS